MFCFVCAPKRNPREENLVIVDDSVAFLQACAAELNFGGVRNSATDSDPCVSLSGLTRNKSLGLQHRVLFDNHESAFWHS